MNKLPSLLGNELKVFTAARIIQREIAAQLELLKPTGATSQEFIVLLHHVDDMLEGFVKGENAKRDDDDMPFRVGDRVRLNFKGRVAMCTPARGWPKDHWALDQIGTVISVDKSQVYVSWARPALDVVMNWSDHLGADCFTLIKEDGTDHFANGDWVMLNAAGIADGVSHYMPWRRNTPAQVRGFCRVNDVVHHFVNWINPKTGELDDDLIRADFFDRSESPR